VRAEEQMVDSDAGRSISTGAVVTHAQTSRDWPVRDCPGDSVRVPDLAITADVSVARGVTTTGPQPATIGRLDTRPEPLMKRGIGATISLHLVLQDVGATVGERLPRSPGPCASGQYRPGVP
jgi:hypothetical protein